MTPRILDLHVNPSDETICFWPIAICFLVTAKDSGGSVAVFEGTVPGGAAPGSAGAQPQRLRRDGLRDRRSGDLNR